MMSATKRGQSKRGKTLPMIMKNSVRKSMPECGSTRVRKQGARVETRRLQSTMYVTAPLREPPNFCTITAEAVAVGQIKQSIAPSQRIFPLRVSGKYRAASEHKTKRLPCVRSKIPCQRWGFRFFGSTFRKERKSILKMSVGWRMCEMV